MKKILAFALALAMGMSLAACGGKKSRTIEDIQAEGKIYMCTNASFPPFEYGDASGKPTGVDVEVAQAIADELGVELEVMDMNFDLLIQSVQSGKADFAAAGMTINPDRLKQVDFSVEYVTSAQYVIVKAGSDITVDNLDGLTIAVQEATTGDVYVSEEVEAKEIMRFKSGVEAGTALRTGKCDAVVIDQKPAESIAANSDGELIVLADPATDKESYAIAVNKGNQELLDAINSVLEKMIAEGKIDELVTKHMSQT